MSQKPESAVAVVGTETICSPQIRSDWPNRPELRGRKPTNSTANDIRSDHRRDHRLQ